MSLVEHITADMADTLLPMHLRIDGAGIVCHAGPGLRRLADRRALVGAPFLAAFEVARPIGIRDHTDLLAMGRNRKLSLRFREGRQVALRGVVAPVARGGGAFVDLSLGLSELRDLGGASLTSRDFSPTDPTVDMLYLIEANNAVMAESRRLIERLQGAKRMAETEAVTDTLTGLRNRRALDRALSRLGRDGAAFTLMQIDLDLFKAVNDRHGHAAGDAVLCHAARVLSEVTRATDVAARAGGDEFVLVLRGLTDAESVDRIARRVISGLERPIMFRKAELRISASIGVAISTDHDRPDPDDLIQCADRALYAAKEAGRGRHVIDRPSARP